MANKVWVAVVPNTKNFASDLRKFLNRVEKTLELHVDVRADTRRAEDEVRSSVERMARSTATINVDADTAHAERKIKDLTDSRDATVNVDADTGLASAQIAAVSRRRKVELAVQVSKSSLATVGTALAALSGARVAQSALSNIGDTLSNLDRSVPAIAGLAMTIGSLGSVALSSVSGLVTMGAALAPLGALVAPLPGLLIAGGAAIGVFAAAMADAGTQLGSLKGGFSALQDSISGAFWEQAKQPILDLVNGVLPSLQSGLTKVASSLGSWSSSVAKSFQAAFPASVIGTITGGLSAAIDASTQGTDAFAASLASLSTFAAQYLPGIGNWFSDISIQFNDFIQRVTSSGELAGWVQEAGVVLGQLGAVFSNTFGILGNIADAAFAAGGSGLQTLANSLGAINQVTSTPVFQGALTTLFQGAAEGAAGLAAALGPIGGALAGLAPALSGALAGLGATAGDLIGGIVSALNQPMVATGLTDLVAGINAGVQGLLPSLPALASAFGSVMSVVGTLAGILGPVLGAALGTLAPLLTSLATAIQPVIAMLGPALTSAITALAPMVMSLASAFMPIVSAILPVLSTALAAVVPLIASLTPVFTTLVAALAPLVTAILPLFQAALAIVLPVIQALMPAIAALIPPIVQVATIVAQVLTVAFQAITPVIMAVVSAVVPIIQSLATIISGVVNVISGLLSGNFSQAWRGAQQIVSGVWGVITGVVSGAIGIVRSVITAGVNAVRSVISSVFGGLGGIVRGAMSAMGSAVSSGISTVMSFFSSLPGKITSALSSFGSLLVSVGRNLMQGFINGVSGFAGRMISAVTAPIKGAIDGAKSLLGIHSPSRVFRQIGDYVGQGLVQGLKGSTSGVQRASRSMSNAVASAFESKKITRAQANALNRAIGSGNAQLTKLAAQRGSIATRLAAANKQLTAAQTAKTKYRDSVLSGLTKVDVTSSKTGDGLVASLQKQLADTKTFTATMAKLRKAGLDAASYKQFIAKGVDALPLAQDLLAGGKGQIKQVASLQGQLSQASTSFANSAANDLYGAGVNAAKGLVNGLKSQQGAIAKQMQTIANTMTRSVKRALGIHSPSRVFRDEVGRQIVAGLALGINGNASSAHSALDDLVGYVPSAALSRAATFPAAAAGGAAGGLPESITLVDADGSILTRAKVIATSAVTASRQKVGTSLQTGSRIR